MPQYRFHDIFDEKEFQQFARDIVQIRENLIFECFGDGRDNGQDGRFIDSKGNCTVLQVKRYLRYDNTSLKKEVEKVKKINPHRYILVLSYDCEPQTKEEIKNMFHPYIKRTSDIILNADLNNLLGEASGKYKKIVNKYNKLWIYSTDILKEFLEDVVNEVVYDDSEENLRLAVEENQYFIKTNIYEKAVKKLEANHVILISGEPGMGKTMLANQLALGLLQKDRDKFLFQAKYYWVTTVAELKAILHRRKNEEQKIIIFDDFWGSVLYKNSHRGREEEELGKLLEKIHKEKKDYFILTTRHYILEQGLKQHDDIRNIIERNKLECRLADYTEEEKQKIFYQHLVKAEMEYNQTIALFKAASLIIHSPNYNPRVIDMFVRQISKEDKPNNLPSELIGFLDEPEAFWNKIFENLSKEARYLYIVLSIMPKNSNSQFVEEVYSHAITVYSHEFIWKEYTKVIAELEKTVIRTNLTSRKNMIIQFQNPSMKQMIDHYVHKHLEQNKKILLESCIYFRQAVILLQKLAEHKEYDAYYAEVMGKAFSLRGTKNIDIIQEWIEETDEYIGNGRIMETDIEVTNMLDLFQLYKSDICSKWKESYTRFLYQYLNIMKKSPHELRYYHIEEFPSLAINAVRENILYDLSYLLDIYKNLIIRNGLALDYEAFMSFNEKCCRGHIEQNREEIEKYIYCYYDYRICLAAASGDAEDFTYYQVSYEDTCDFLNIASREQLWESVQMYESWIEQELKEYWKDESSYDRKGKGFKEVEAAYWNRFLAIEAGDQDMNLIMSPEGDHLLDFEYYIKKIFLQLEVGQAFSPSEMADILTELGCCYYEEGKKAWRRGEFEELCLNKLNIEISEEQIAMFFQLNFFGKVDKWIYISEPNVFLITFLYQFFYTEGRNREQDYEQFFGDEQESSGDRVIQLGLQIDAVEHEMILTCFLQLDGGSFKKYVVNKRAKEFYENNYATENNMLIENLLDALECEIEVDEEGAFSAIICKEYFILEYIEYKEDYSVEDIISVQFTEKQREFLVKERMLDENNMVSLQQLYENGLLKTTGIEERLMKMWTMILEYIKE